MTLRASVLSTLAYFDTQEYPLTAVEVWTWLYAPYIQRTVLPTIGEMHATLATLVAEQTVAERDGFFFLPHAPQVEINPRGQSSGFPEDCPPYIERKRRERVSFYKLRRARRAARLISWIPWIRLVAAANTLSWRHAKEESDIDLFIVTAQARIWSVRLLVGATLSLFGLRRHGTHIKDRMCLSFFATEDALDLSKIAICESDDRSQKSEILNLKSEIFDIYLLYWIVSLIPLLDRGGMRMVEEANGWVRGHLPNFKFQISKCKFFDSRLNLKSKILNLKSIELIARWFQLRKMRAHPHGSRATSTAVVISDQMLKFHEEDRRQEIAEAWQATLHWLQIL